MNDVDENPTGGASSSRDGMISMAKAHSMVSMAKAKAKSVVGARSLMPNMILHPARTAGGIPTNLTTVPKMSMAKAEAKSGVEAQSLVPKMSMAMRGRPMSMAVKKRQT